YGALPLTEGKGEVAGFLLQNLNRKTIPLLRRKLGIVFQDFNLLSDRTVEDNLRFVLDATNWKDEQKIKQRMAQVLEQVDLKGQEKKMPHQLSGGEQQRVAIARALLKQPKILLADEPTGELDSQTGRLIFDLLRNLHAEHGVTVITVTHDERYLREGDRILSICDGRVAESAIPLGAESV
ncbi:MAG: ATP-binding cassette domain-containing protein, partial [Planctomycetaceae bacterium]|nr:ATP-binding cassette domain-containing protein [Planctomycetaceae bacterium]